MAMSRPAPAAAVRKCCTEWRSRVNYWVHLDAVRWWPPCAAAPVRWSYGIRLLDERSVERGHLCFACPNHCRSVTPLDIEEELKESYLNYAMSVIISRALPDVRDGLKPSQRRILVAMRDLGLNPGGSTSKCAGIVGETMKRYHPHGENSIYPTLTRMGQWWNSRHLLVTPQGNFGSIHGLAAGGDAVHRGQAQPGRGRDARGHPARHGRFPAELRREVPGASGASQQVSRTCWSTARGASRSGWRRRCRLITWEKSATHCLPTLTNPTIDLDSIMQLLPGPDFPTGATICGRMGIKEAYMTGRGRVTVRAKYDFEELKDGRTQIIFTEIPYQLTKEMLLKKLAELVNARPDHRSLEHRRLQ